ncbi:MAG TPA: type II secretion system protein GspL [Steroidobacteraceae bacterium]|nr:type II secretion system protein GspL [Steroidobacteraceae bacterium]
MADWLLLRLPRTPEEPASWLIASAAGAPLAATQSGPLTDAAGAAAGRRLCALVSGSDVLLAEPELPAKSGSRLQQLVPYALEEQLADNIDELHFALGRRAGDSNRTPVAVVARELMNAWLAELRAAGLEPDCLYADSELLPVNPGQAVALLEEDTVIVRAPGAPPVSLPIDALAEALDIAASPPRAAAALAVTAPPPGTESGSESSAGEAARGLILYSGTAEWQQHSAQVEQARAPFASVKVQLLSDGPLALFAQQLPGAAAINLLQGAYAPKSSRAAGLSAWRVAAMLLIGLVALHVVGKAAELRVLKAREHEVDASISDTFHRAMPAEPGTTDARRRMEQRLATVRSSGGSSGLLGALQAVAQARGGSAGTSVQSLNFHDGLLELTLNAPDAASLDHLSQQLRNGGWQADLVGGNTVGSAYQGRVQIRAQGP